jgi:cobalamin biosynthesis protein CobT
MAYKVYTREFDQVIDGALLTDPREVKWAADKLGEVDRCLAEVRKGLAAAPPSQRQGTVVSLLVDHSGSLRGEPSIVMAMLVEAIAEFLYRAGVTHEILGFTTTAWKGGESRKQWLNDGKPSNPGRLTDLLHIVYRAADDDAGPAPTSFRSAILRQGLLKENIDGEAIEWAAERHPQLPERAFELRAVFVARRRTDPRGGHRHRA